MVNTPVALIIFNRPDTTKQVLAEIAKVKPSKLYVIADGPREGCPEDVEKCSAAREVIEGVDWECEVFKNYSDVNLGCGQRPATGISWIFHHEEETIILEDDCVPHPTFFRFCAELLKKYRHDERVMMISGRNSLGTQSQMSYSYSFRRIMSCWGWATWRRAWHHYDMEMKLWPTLRNTPWLLDILGDHRAVEYWQNIFEQAHGNAGEVDYWDYQWLFACWAQNGLAIVPRNNLIRNIGYGPNSTHTKSPNSPGRNLPTEDMVFPLRHPPYVVPDREAELLLLERGVLKKRQCPTLYRRVRRKLSAVSKLLRSKHRL